MGFVKTKPINDHILQLVITVLRKDSLQSNYWDHISSPKHQKTLYELIVSQISDVWCPCANALTRDAVGTRYL